MALGPERQRDQVMVAIAILAGVLAGAYWYFAYSPKKLELETLAQRVDSVEAANQRARAEFAKGTAVAVRRDAVRHERSLAAMRLLVPTSNEVPALLEQVSTAARRTGLDLAGVQPMPVVSGDAFDTYRYRISVIGSYHALAEFLTNVGSLTRIVAPVNVNLVLSADHSDVATRARGQALDAHFDILTYVTKTGVPRAAVPPPPPASGSAEKKS